ncbi:MAG: hypothetical protein Q9222_001533 [Ikaeria aurantiellina]
MDPGMNQLLKWSIENSDSTRNDPVAATDPKAERSSGQGLTYETVKSLMGGPSDAELMKQSMAAIQSAEVSLENKVIAFDNFEQLIEIVDNANNMETLGLWSPLVAELNGSEAELRRMAAWCIGTAVQNNIKSQERFVAVRAIPRLTRLALEDQNELVRRKAIYALSSGIRNYSPALDALIQQLPQDMRPDGKVDAGDMDEVDKIIDVIKQRSARANA